MTEGVLTTRRVACERCGNDDRDRILVVTEKVEGPRPGERLKGLKCAICGGKVVMVE